MAWPMTSREHDEIVMVIYWNDDKWQWPMKYWNNDQWYYWQPMIISNDANDEMKWSK